MVDEEEEKVLTTEELRVEVSRFLKGVSLVILSFKAEARSIIHDLWFNSSLVNYQKTLRLGVMDGPGLAFPLTS